MKIEQIAQVCHEVNASFCSSIGDNSQPSWEDAPEWQKSSAINGVRFHLENPDATPSASHDSWLKQKTEEGWKYGEVKDAEKKEHPCFVPYEQLPTEQKSKDYLFKQIIHSLKKYFQNEENTTETQIDWSAMEYNVKREPSFGEKLVGLTFNPSGDAKVQRAKELCSELADLIKDDYMSKESSTMQSRLFEHAVGEILNAQMNVVKVLTFKY